MCDTIIIVGVVAFANMLAKRIAKRKGVQK